MFFRIFENKKMYLDNYINQIKNLCLKHKVKYLFVFGSVLTENFTDNSDIDLIIDINTNDPIDYAENYFSFKFKLEDLLKRKIDLLEQKALKNKYLIENIDRTKRIIYAA